MPLAYIALGSNLGDRVGQMRQALQLLEDAGFVSVLRVSPVYQNRAIGMGEDADDFLNAVVEVGTEFKAMELLDACLDVEQQLGRVRAEEGWAPRTIDLDLLFFESVSMQDERLTLPHPRIAERDFVAVPLADLVPELEIDGRTAQQIVEALGQSELSSYPEKLL